jgi:hypothetical protein
MCGHTLELATGFLLNLVVTVVQLLLTKQEQNKTITSNHKLI